jgi:thiol-disulfide isomerase/thioredoxin
MARLLHAKNQKMKLHIPLVFVNLALIFLLLILYFWQKNYDHSVSKSIKFDKVLSNNHPVIFANVWATWCKPCLEEIKHLEKIRRRFEDQPIDFVAITSEDSIKVNQFLNRSGINFTFRQIYNGAAIIADLQNAAQFGDLRLPSAGIIYPTSFLLSDDEVIYTHRSG